MNDVTSTARGWQPSIATLCGSAVLGAFIWLLVISAAYPFFAYPDLREIPIEPGPQHQELIAQHVKARGEFYAHNYAAAFGSLGVCLGLVIGLLTVRSRKLPSVLAGAVFGGLGGAAAGYFIGTPIGEAIEMSQGFSLGQASLYQAAVWAAITAGVMLGIGLVQGGVLPALTAVVSGLVASVMAVAFYLMSASILFLRDNMTHVLPESLAHRLFWIVTCTLIIGAVVARGLRPSKPKPAADTSAESEGS